MLRLLQGLAARLGLRNDLLTVAVDVDGDGEVETASYFLRKAAHVTEFALYAALLWFRLGHAQKRRGWIVLTAGVCTAAVDETLQIFSHRGSSVKDVLIDTGGVLLGMALAALLERLRHGKTE